MLIERKPDESELSFHKRLVYGKLVDRTLQEYSYSDVAEMTYGKRYADDVARRMLYGSRRTLDIVAKEGFNTGTSTLDELDLKMAEFKKEKQKLFDQRREYNKLLSEAGRAEHLYDRLADAAENIASSRSLYESIISHGDIETHGADDYNEAVLVLSDWHFGMTTDNVFNTYNEEVCQERIAKVVYDTKKRIALHESSKLHIVILGDLIHGGIHCTARVASEELVCDQLMKVSEILAEAIIALRDSVSEIDVHMTYGNHARTIQNKKESIHRDNIERIIPWWLKQRMSDFEGIEIKDHYQNEFMTFSIMGHDICAVHGDLDSVKTSPRLLYTLFNKKYNKNLEYILLGDKHHRESFEELGVTSIICGSLCGSDDYASEKRLFSSPSQMLLIVKADGVDAEYQLKV